MASPDPLAAAIGSAVRGALAAAGISHQQGADHTKTSLATFSRRVNGHIPFTWPELVQIADLTGVPVSDLVASYERIAKRTGAVA